MRNDSTTLLLAAGLGAISGIRSMSAIALLGWNAHHPRHGGGKWARHIRSRLHGNGRSATALLRTRHADAVTATMAAGEMAADKAADLPPRTDVPSILGRAAFGALSGVIVAEARSGNRATAALVGAVSAVGSAHLFYRLRSRITENSAVPDWVVGLAEDVLVLAGGKQIVDQLR